MDSSRDGGGEVEVKGRRERGGGREGKEGDGMRERESGLCDLLSLNA